MPLARSLKRFDVAIAMQENLRIRNFYCRRTIVFRFLHCDVANTFTECKKIRQFSNIATCTVTNWGRSQSCHSSTIGIPYVFGRGPFHYPHCADCPSMPHRYCQMLSMVSWLSKQNLSSRMPQNPQTWSERPIQSNFASFTSPRARTSLCLGTSSKGWECMRLGRPKKRSVIWLERKSVTWTSWRAKFVLHWQKVDICSPFRFRLLTAEAWRTHVKDILTVAHETEGVAWSCFVLRDLRRVNIRHFLSSSHLIEIERTIRTIAIDE